jgi:uroporphyrinogen decarboxylase
MNSYQRFMTTLERKQPDRIPIVEWSISPKVFQAILPQAESQSDFEDAMNFDGVSTAFRFDKVREYADGSYMDEWGVIFKPSPEMIDHPLRGPIQSKDDLKRYTPPDPDAPHRLGNLPELVARFKGRRAIIFRHRAAFMWSVFIRGFENLLMDFLLDPEFAHELMEKVLAMSLRVARNAIRAGADAIVIADDYAGNQGPFFSPAVAREFVIPRLKRMVDAIHEEGGKAIKHSDGNLWPILDPMVGTGIDGLNPIEPLAGMDIGEVKKRYGDRVCLIGNIDCGHLLPYGTAVEVEAAVKDCIARAATGGGLILSSSNSIHSSVNPANYRAMIEAVRKYGCYPNLVNAVQ